MPVNSHFVPQLLLKGFAYRSECEKFYVHVFRKDSPSFSANTKNVATQRNFYGDETIESALSSGEAKFAELVRYLRQGQCVPDDKPSIDRFVVHSLVRTRTFRDGVHTLGATVMEKAFREFLDPELTPQLLQNLANDVTNQPEVKNILGQVTPEKRPHLQLLMRQMLEHPDMHEELRRMILQTLPTIDTASSVQSAQRRVLEDERTLDRRIRNLEKVTWSIDMYPANSLVLGDMGPLVKGDGSLDWGRVFYGTPQLVWFPLSHNSLLRGQVTPGSDQVASEEVNWVSVENSAEFFVASQRTIREEKYQDRLGSRASQHDEENLSELHTAIREYLESSGGTLSID